MPRKSSGEGVPRTHPTRVGADKLRWQCEAVAASARPPRPATLLGQSRPLEALRRGLSLYAPGFNVFLSGLQGSGRLYIVQRLLEDLQPQCRLAPDRAFVHNFNTPNQPRHLALPRGRGPEFSEDVADLLRAVRDGLQSRLNSRAHRTSRRLILNGTEERYRRLLRALERQASRRGCALVEVQEGQEITADILPVVEGEAVPVDELDQHLRGAKGAAAKKGRLLRHREELLERLEEVTRRTRRMYRETHQELRRMDREVALRVLNGLFGEFRERWPQEEIARYLQQVEEYIEHQLHEWIAVGEDGGDARAGESVLQRLRVHVVETGTGDECPVVVESNPSYTNLFGTIEPRQDAGNGHATVERVHPGSLLRADGGYLILRAADLWEEHGVWQQLKRALKSGTVEVREFDPSAGTTAGSLRPEAVPIDVKVIMIGDPGHYEALAGEDSQFLQIFKVHAEFDSTVPNSAANRRRYADFLSWLGRREEMLRFRPEAAAALCEFGARAAGRRDRLSTNFGDLADVARESSFLASEDGRREVRAEHIRRAIADRIGRRDLSREIYEREFQHGSVLLKTHGAQVGQVNAMTVLETGTFRFGYPVRVSATTGPASDGKTEVVDIERESDLSGPIHDKGVLILQGFLLDRFGRDRAIGLQATLCFEQLYSEVDGDSATLAELIALLSSLARVPVRQNFGVTGSLNQMGQVQSVGGVNDKIEGFWRACQHRRRGGAECGVLLPRANVANLMLDQELVDAAGSGALHVHGIETVEHAIEVLMGLPAVDLYRRVEARLRQFADVRSDDPGAEEG